MSLLVRHTGRRSQQCHTSLTLFSHSSGAHQSTSQALTSCSRQHRSSRTLTSSFASPPWKSTAHSPLSSLHQWSHVVHAKRRITRTDAVEMVSCVSSDGVQKRHHGGHSHGHGNHHHDNTYLTSKNRSDPGVRITRIGLYVNLGMAIAKGAGGVIFNSQALTADALHALTDLVSDVMTLATISYSLRPPTSRFPLGYGKIESLGALAVSGLLLSGGIMIGLQAAIALSQQFFPDFAHFLSHFMLFGHGHDHHHGANGFGPNINAAWLAGGSIVIKEWLYRATLKIAKQKRSNVLESNAYHHRVDSLTAFVALITISASQFFNNAQWLDPVGGLLISGMIVQAGWGNTKAALLELADVALDPEIRQSVDTAANQALSTWSDLLTVRGVQGVKSGQNFLVDIEIAAPSSWTLSQQEEAEYTVRQRVTDVVRGVHRVSIRFVPRDTESPAPFLDQFADKRADTVAELEQHDHNHTDTCSHEHSNGHSSSTEANPTLKQRSDRTER